MTRAVFQLHIPESGPGKHDAQAKCRKKHYHSVSHKPPSSLARIEPKFVIASIGPLVVEEQPGFCLRGFRNSRTSRP